jgi:hypothetical protein
LAQEIANLRGRFPTRLCVTFDQYLAAYALGRLRSSDLPEAAMQAMVEGYECVELAALAGSTSRSGSPSELEEMWRRGLTDVKKTIPSRADAGRILRDHYATLVASGAMSPRSGAAEIVRIATDLDADLSAQACAAMARNRSPSYCYYVT